jgi:DNA-binding IclR family transcriptional regulator
LNGLLDGAVDPVGSIELLLLLRNTDERPHQVDELCATLGSPRSWTELQLDALVRSGLVERLEDGWRYAPASATLASAVDQLADAWRRDGSAVRRWVFRPPRRSRRHGTA